MYKMLFEASWHTLETLGWDQKFLGAQLGAVMTLHTWGQTLSLHPHLHCIVPGGGVDYKRQWRSVRGKGKFLFPVRVMSRIFRGKYISLLKKFLNDEGMVYCSALHNSLYQKDWVVYCKQPFVGSKGVVEYLARYTYKTAISNHRISGKDIHCVEIRYKDYRHGGKVKYMRLAKTEFIRRFSLHILPKGFTRIRHYGILSGRLKHELLDIPKPLKQEDSWEAYWLSKGLDVRLCPICKTGKLIHIKELPKRGPPKNQTTNKTNM
jgi:hypothetical protein